MHAPAFQSLLRPAHPRLRALLRAFLAGVGLLVLGASVQALQDPPPDPGPPPGPPEGDGPPPDEELIAEFQRYFRKYKDASTRVEAILTLDPIESGEVVQVLVPVLGDAEPRVVEAAVRVLGSFASAEPVAALTLRFEKERDKTLQAGFLEAVTLGRYGAALPLVLPKLADKDWTLRRRAALAVTAIGGDGAPEALLPLCNDAEVAVHCTALDGLAALGSELVLDPARADLKHESWQVRASAIAALGKVRRVDSFEPLIVVMETEEGRLVEDAAKALVELTGQDYGLRPDGWRRFFETWKGRYKIPTDEELAKLKEARAKSKELYVPAEGSAAFVGVETPSRSILFVIDISGSMEQKIVERERYNAPEYDPFRRIDVVKAELIKTIQGLQDYVEFNILSFATDVNAWKKRQVKANVLNKSSAIDWIKRLEPIGGESKEDLAAVGLTGAANLEGGKTNTYLALMSALGADDGARRVPDYEVTIDTVFFLSDGLPSIGRLVDTDDLLKAVREENELRHIRLHAMGIGSFQKDFLKQLARENGGEFVDLGR